MFHPYFELGGRIRKHYLSPSVFLSLASGQFVPPIHRRTLYSLQYSMLPAERATVAEMWDLLTQSESAPAAPEAVKTSTHTGSSPSNGHSRYLTP